MTVGSDRQRRRPGRRPGPNETRQAILDSARRLFAEKGYVGASIRAIARDAGVDPALIHHFFGTKENVFITATQFPINPAQVLPAVLSGPREEIGRRVVQVFMAVWSQPSTREALIAMIRAAMTNDQVAAMIRQFLSSALLTRIAEHTGSPSLRVEAAGAQMIGVVMARYVLRIEPMASAGDDELMDLLAPTIQRYLTAD